MNWENTNRKLFITFLVIGIFALGMHTPWASVTPSWIRKAVKANFTGTTINADTIGTAALNDGTDTPALGESICVDDADTGKVKYDTCPASGIDFDNDDTEEITTGGTNITFDVDDDGTDEFTFSTTGIDVPRTVAPQAAFGDSDAAVARDNCSINANLTDTGDGTEDCDMTFKQHIAGSLTTWLTSDADGVITFARDVAVPDEAYNESNWNASAEAPTKNAVRDKIEAIDTSGVYSAPFGPFGNDQAGVVAANNCECWRTSIPHTITPDRIGVNVSTQDADDVANLAIYSSDGNTRHATCTLVVTASGYKNCTDGGATVMTPGDYWFCVGAGVGSPVVFQLKRAGGGDLYVYADLTTTCTTGVMPATISFTPALTNDSVPYVVIFDD